MNEIAFICMYCGDVIFLPKDNNPRERNKCPKCGGSYLPASTKQLPDVTQEQYQNMINNNTWNDYLIKHMSILPYVRNLQQSDNHSQSQPTQQPQPTQQFTPKCPTCGCTDIRRISATEKAVNIGMFGLFGNKRRYQFECLNPACKYKW